MDNFKKKKKTNQSCEYQFMNFVHSWLIQRWQNNVQTWINLNRIRESTIEGTYMIHKWSLKNTIHVHLSYKLLALRILSGIPLVILVYVNEASLFWHQFFGQKTNTTMSSEGKVRFGFEMSLLFQTFDSCLVIIEWLGLCCWYANIIHERFWPTFTGFNLRCFFRGSKTFYVIGCQ